MINLGVNKSKQARKRQSGFTLVELSIVLVIIGLIVSGVLVGQDLIQAARIRAQIRQIQELDTTINAFRAKYNGLPGDLANADGFGLVAAADKAASGTQGDGVIEGSVATAATEASLVFRELSAARLVADALSTSETPSTKLERGRMAAFSSDGINYWMFGAASSGSPAVTSDATIANGAGFSGFELWSVDTRMDDGVPHTGLMRAAQGAGTAYSGVALTATTGTAPGAVMGDPADCVNAANEVYIIDVSSSTAAGNIKNCAFITRING